MLRRRPGDPPKRPCRQTTNHLSQLRMTEAEPSRLQVVFFSISRRSTILINALLGLSMTSRLFLPVLALVVFFVGATEFMIAPILTPIASAFDVSPAAASWLISGYALSYAIGAPIIGLLAHKIDRKQLLLCALALLAADGLAVAFAPTLGSAILLRVLGGAAAAALIPATFALIADRLPDADHARAMGLVMLGMTAGIALGPPLAGVLTQMIGWRAPFLASAAGCVALMLPVNLILRTESPPPFRRGRLCFKDLKKTILMLIAAKALWNGSAVAAFGLSGEFLRERFTIDTFQTGLSVAAFGIGLAFGNLSIGIAKQLLRDDQTLLLGALLLLAFTLNLFLFAPLPLYGAILCLGGWGVALGFAAPASTAMIAQRAGREKGFLLALSESANNLALLSMLSVAALLLEAFGAKVAGATLGFGLSFGAGLLLLYILVQSRVRRCAAGSCGTCQRD